MSKKTKKPSAKKEEVEDKSVAALMKKYQEQGFTNRQAAERAESESKGDSLP